MTQEEKNDALYKAVARGSLEEVNALLKDGADVNAVDDGEPLIYRAVGKGNEHIVRTLIEAGADVNVKRVKCCLVFSEFRTFEDDTPLHEAAKLGYANIASILIEAGADIEAKSYSHKTPLDTAASFNHYNVAKLLIDAGANVNSGKRWTPLHSFAERNNIPAIKALIAAGADVDAKTWFGQKPIDVARQRKRTDAVRFLREESDERRNVKFFGKKNQMLVDAIISRNIDVSHHLILSDNVDVDLQNACGMNALHFSASLKEEKPGAMSEATFFHMVERSANLNAKDSFGNTPLHYSIENRKYGKANLLIRKKANVNAQNDEGDTPLHIAVRNMDEKAVEMLLENHANCCILNNKKESPLYIAVSFPFELKLKKIIKLLLNSGAKVDRSIIERAEENLPSYLIQLLEEKEEKEQEQEQ